VREPSFLEFNCINLRNWIAEYVSLAEFSEDGFQIKIEYSSDDVMAVRCHKAEGKIGHNFVPSWIASKRNEEVCATVMATYRHGVLVKLFHLPSSSYNRRG
jgi:hypothetical protein